jgi:lycopene cyclase domain-containing protein
MKWLYLLIDVFTVIVPILFSFHPKLNFYKNWKPFFIANSIVAVLFILWDVLFTHLGVWGFNPNYISGIYFFNLPIEEILFFICIPYACVFTYHCLNLFFKIEWSVKTENVVAYSLIVVLFVFGIYFYGKLYTASTFISLAMTLFIIKYFFKSNWLSRLLCIYPVLLIPFFIVNGILTGSGLPHPVVWYNDAENLGNRLVTIPVEDIFYGFELILLNVFLYEFFKKKINKVAVNISH